MVVVAVVVIDGLLALLFFWRSRQRHRYLQLVSQAISSNFPFLSLEFPSQTTLLWSFLSPLFCVTEL